MRKKQRWILWVAMAATVVGVISSLFRRDWLTALWAGCAAVWILNAIEAEKLLQIKDEYIEQYQRDAEADGGDAAQRVPNDRE